MAVITASQKISATVKVICAVKEGQYGLYQSVLIESPQLLPGMPAVKEAGKLWKSMTPEDAAKLSKGMTVTLTPTRRNGGDTWDIEVPTAPAPTIPATATGYSPLTDDSKRAIGAYVGEMAALYSFCRQQAMEHLPGAPDETIQSATASLFIAAQRKFHLA